MNKLIDGSQAFSRSLPRRSALQENPVLSDTLRQVLASGSLSGDLEDNPGLTKCYKYGWLQAELDRNDKTIYYFPTHMHQMYVLSIGMSQASMLIYSLGTLNLSFKATKKNSPLLNILLYVTLYLPHLEISPRRPSCRLGKSSQQAPPKYPSRHSIRMRCTELYIILLARKSF